jgi:tRNA G46 methylase TrmB
MSLNPVAQSGFANSTAYDAHRPTYPPESLAMLIDALGVAGASAARVLDLAAGTGKFTAQLAARPEGFEIMAVEPHAGMREVLEGKVLEGGVWKHVRVVEGRAEDMARVEGGWADAVVVAQVSFGGRELGLGVPVGLVNNDRGG